MKEFNGIQYCAINVANHYGLDKKPFDERIKWVKDNLNQLESLANQADDNYLFIKAVKTLRQAQNKEKTGAYIFLDASASGLQLMSAMTGDLNGATLTNMVDGEHFFDAYTAVTDKMNSLLTGLNLQYPRKDIKECVLVHFYGGKDIPTAKLGDHYPLFLQACQETFTGATELLEVCKNSWRSYAKSHSWVLPDNFHVFIPVTNTVVEKRQIEELFGYNMSISHTRVEGRKYAVANGANIIHSIDAYLLREMVRRCNYNEKKLINSLKCILNQIDFPQPKHKDDSLAKYEELFNQCETVSAVVLEKINQKNVTHLSKNNLLKLKALCKKILTHKSFEIVTVHDAFGCHPNNANRMRYWYTELLAELAESDVLGFILSKVYGHSRKIPYPKQRKDLGDIIRQSNYALS